MTFVIILIILIILIFIGGYFGAPWLPTLKSDFKRIEDLISFKNKKYFYELGSGTGNLLFYLAKKYNNVDFIGIEISPILFFYSKIKSLFYKNVDIKFGNFLKYNLSQADIIYFFMQEKIYKKFLKKINSEKTRDIQLIISTWPLLDIFVNKISKQKSRITYYLYNLKSS
jgi:SAM-dependent methyltransferase